VTRNSQSLKSGHRSRAASGRTARRPAGHRSVAPRVLKDIIARVVAAARPERIILFGSAARGTMGPNSDVDLLVVKGGQYDRGKVTTDIYRHLCGADAAVDVVVVTPEEVERYRGTPCLVICPAVREGRVVYLA
jgi:predicted nucleotidyltransferase